MKTLVDATEDRMSKQGHSDSVMSAEAVAVAAEHLHALRLHGAVGERLRPEYRPTLPSDGWRIQQRVVELRNMEVVGWKCGLPQADRWIVAALHECLSTGAVVGAPAITPEHVRVEPELAFVLRHDLLPRANSYEPVEVDRALGSTHLALEVLGCRFAHASQASGPELMADSLWHHTMVLGPTVAADVPTEFTLQILCEGGPLQRIHARHPDGNPRSALYWLAEFLREQGIGMRAGQTIITGSFAGAVDLPFGHVTTFRYGGLGEISLMPVPLSLHSRTL